MWISWLWYSFWSSYRQWRRFFWGAYQTITIKPFSAALCGSSGWARSTGGVIYRILAGALDNQSSKSVPYEKDDRHQHAPYPWLLLRVAIVDLDLDGIAVVP